MVGGRPLALLAALVMVAPGVSAIAFVNDHSDSGNPPLRVNHPNNTEAGDVMLVVLAFQSAATNVITPPSGWSQIARQDGTDLGLAIYAKTATASEPNNYEWAFSQGGKAVAGILTYEGVDLSASIGTGAFQFAPATSTMTAPSTTALGSGLVVGAFAINHAKNPDDASGMTRRARANSGGGASGVGLWLGDASVSAGPTSVYSTTAGATAETVGVQILLRMPTLSFVGTSSSGFEWSTSPVIQVQLSGATSVAVTATVAATGGTATAADFTLNPTTLTFPAGTTTVNLPLTIQGDAASEADETILFTLSSPTNAALGAQTTFTYTIKDDDPYLVVAADPVDSAGVAQTGQRWGGWNGMPGASVVPATNYLKVTCRGPPSATYTVDFTPTAFAGLTAPADLVPINNNVQFAAWVDTTPTTSSPSEGTYVFGASSATGATSGTCGNGNVLYVTYRLAAIPDLLLDQPFSASYTVSSP